MILTSAIRRSVGCGVCMCLSVGPDSRGVGPAVGCVAAVGHVAAVTHVDGWRNGRGLHNFEVKPSTHHFNLTPSTDASLVQ